MSSSDTSTAAWRIRRQRNNKPLTSQDATVKRKHWNRNEVGGFTISQELIADRLRCMVEHVRDGNTSQVLLHTVMIANTLNLKSRNVQSVRDIVQEAQGLFLRGSRRLALARLADALDQLGPAQKQRLPIGPAPLETAGSVGTGANLLVPVVPHVAGGDPATFSASPPAL